MCIHLRLDVCLALLQSDHTVAKDFRKDVRVMMARLHKKKTTSGQETTSLAALSPEVQGFIQKLADDWHAMLSKKRPRVVAKKMQKEKRSLPSGLEEDHFRWLCRFMARWHRRHAHKCDVMSGWSSGETGDDTSGDEDASPRRRGKRGRFGKHGESGGLSESEDTDCLEKVGGCCWNVILVNTVTQSHSLTRPLPSSPTYVPNH